MEEPSLHGWAWASSHPLPLHKRACVSSFGSVPFSNGGPAPEANEWRARGMHEARPPQPQPDELRRGGSRPLTVLTLSVFLEDLRLVVAVDLSQTVPRRYHAIQKRVRTVG